ASTAPYTLALHDALPIYHRPGPRALIISPTRELAMQIHADVKKLGQFTKVKTATIFGCVSSSGQINALKKNPDILVVCPGRLLEDRKSTRLNSSHVKISY